MVFLPSFSGKHLSYRLSGGRSPEFQEAKMLNRISISWDKGEYPPIAHKRGEKGLVWVRALPLPVPRVSSRNKGIIQREQAASESHSKPLAVIIWLFPPALCFRSYPTLWLSLAFLNQRLHATVLAQNKNAASSGKLGS